MCDGTPCPCNLYGGADYDEHRARHSHPGRNVPRSDRAERDTTAGLWRRFRATLRCGHGLGHCLHLHADSSPMEPEWYCCECPREKTGFPAGDCWLCSGPGVGVAP